MTSDHRITWNLVTDILDTLERHGYHSHDDQHTGQTVLMIGDLTDVYTGRDTHPSQIAPQMCGDTRLTDPRHDDHDADREVGQ